MRIPATLLLLTGFFSRLFALDSSTVNLGMVLKQVSANHPTAKQAALLPKQGEAYLRYARGGFDPKVFFTQREKPSKQRITTMKLPPGLVFPHGMAWI
jgi:hypothetical protein